MTVHPLVFNSPSDGVLLAPPHCGLLVVPDFVRQVRSWCATTTRAHLVVDLSQVEAFEAGAFRALLWARRYCMSHGISLTIVPPRNGVLPVQEAVILCDLFAAQSDETSPRATLGSSTGTLA
jgi:hypothetical protein